MSAGTKAPTLSQKASGGSLGGRSEKIRP